MKMRTFDATTILFNTMYDAKRMLDEGKKPKDVCTFIKKKIDFLENPGTGNQVRW
jgi:hypothetical protein